MTILVISILLLSVELFVIIMFALIGNLFHFLSDRPKQYMVHLDYG